jgi:hypothetical protein
MHMCSTDGGELAGITHRPRVEEQAEHIDRGQVVMWQPTYIQ